MNAQHIIRDLRKCKKPLMKIYYITIIISFAYNFSI